MPRRGRSPFPKVLRRVGGYNLDEFIDAVKPSTWRR